MNIQKRNWQIYGRSMFIATPKRNSIKIVFFSFCRAFGLISLKHLPKLSEIIKILCDNGFSILDCAMYELTRQQSIDITDNILCSNQCSDLYDVLCSGPSVAVVISGRDAIHRLKQLVAGYFWTKTNKIGIFIIKRNCYSMKVQKI